MAVMEVRNDSRGWLVMWLKPLGEDRWLKPDESFRVRSDHTGDEPAFSVTFWVNDDDRSAGIENLTDRIEHDNCDAEVIDSAGNPVECGHQRPAEVDRRSQIALEEAQKRTVQRYAANQAPSS